MSSSKTKVTYPSPLRYPGGKTFLAPELQRILSVINLKKPIYVEPYAGGAGAALSLLFAGKVKKIVINDYDKAIYSFWKAVIESPEIFAQKIISTPVDVSEWKKQKEIYADKSGTTFEIGFATFFLNRTNRSGVMNAGPIGGIKQGGNYKINARYNKSDLAARILEIGKYKSRIQVFNEEGIEFTKKYINKKNTFIYLDPPYMKKGKMLYMNLYKDADHERLAKLLNKNKDSYWALTYEEMKKVRSLYENRKRKRLFLKYGVHDSRNIHKARELMILSTPFVTT